MEKELITMNKWKRLKIYFAIILLVIIEQLTKVIVINNIKDKPITIIKGILKFTYCENKGAAFSLGNGHVPLVIALNIVLLALFVLFYKKNADKSNKLNKMFFTMIMAGGVSNLLDRLIRGYVVDFININDLFQFAIFNIADIFIILGLFGYVVTFIINDKKESFSNKNNR